MSFNRRSSVRVLVPAIALALASSLPAFAGRFIATGHDLDYHCSQQAAQCHFFHVAVDYVRNGNSSKKVLILDRRYSGGGMGEVEEAFIQEFGPLSATPLSYVLETPGDPGSPWLSDPLSFSTYSAIIVASDSSCGGCDLNPGALDIPPLPPNDSMAINSRAGAITDFFNAGGGVLVLAGGHHSDGSQAYKDYYKFLPLPATGSPVAPPFTLTSAGVTTIGLEDSEATPPIGTQDDINCCQTHNSFALPPVGSGIQVAETDGHGQAETIFAEGMISGGEVTSCLQEISHTTQCPTDGSKTFTWNLFIRNLSASPIENVLFIDLPAGVSMTPDQFNFSTPVPALVGTKQLSGIKISGAAPGSTLKFRISTSGKDFQACCAVDYTLELPSCDCAQIVTDREPTCFFPSFPPPFIYNFTVDNLDTIEKTFIVLTPLPGSSGVPPDITFTPDVISGLSLAPVPYNGTQGQTSQRVAIGGPDATGGAQACFLISLQDESCVHCCSITKCLTLPSCTIEPWVGESGTILTFAPDGIVLKASAGGGPSGAVATLDRAATFEMSLGDLDPLGALPVGSLLRLHPTAASGSSAGVDIGSLALTKSVSGLEIAADFTPLGTTVERVEVSSNGRPEALAPQAQGAVVISAQGADSWPTSLAVTSRTGEQTGYFATWAKPVQITLPGLGPFTGNELRISAENAQTPVDSLQTSAIEAQQIPEIDILGADATHDCNHNGVPDKDDIALGTSADVNRNGIPDECEGAARDLQLTLDTGFDPSAGTLLPVGTLPDGTSDPRWQVTNVPDPGPAKVVIQPVGAWPAALPDSRWISVSPERGDSIPGVQRLRFQNCFCLQANTGGAGMSLQLFADDDATVFLNQTQIGGPGGRYSGTQPLSVRVSGAIGGGGTFAAGQNCLIVEVNDSGGVVTGLDLVGSVTAPGGACPGASSHP